MAYKRYVVIAILILSCAGLSSCLDNVTVTDFNQAISKRTWSYVNKVRVPVTISDKANRYNIYINLRHTGDYKYSNIFLLIHTRGPRGKTVTERKEFTLAYPDGQWLGKGSGNLYSYQLPLKADYSFPDTGKYLFEIEQNMRDNPLREITDVGLRIEKSK
jgi:gliding motility-associated lipoprotein GldH